MKNYSNTVNVIGRVLLSVMFILAGISKLGDGYAGTQAYMAAMGVSPALLPWVIITEVGAGITLLLGAFTRISAVLLAGFTLLAAFLFHANLADQVQSILFMKNLAIAGGLLMVTSLGAGRFSIDHLLSRR
jgi:putative oxidoreductase